MAHNHISVNSPRHIGHWDATIFSAVEADWVRVGRWVNETRIYFSHSQPGHKLARSLVQPATLRSQYADVCNPHVPADCVPAITPSVINPDSSAFCALRMIVMTAVI